MSWLALLLIGVGVTDLARSLWDTPVLDEVVGAFVLVWIGLLAGLTDMVDVVALVVLAALVVAWGLTVSRALAGGRPWVPLALLGASVLVGAAVSGVPGPAAGPLGDWLAGVALPALHGLSVDRALLLLAVVLVQLSTGNVVVRLALAASGTVNPALPLEDPGEELKGGRLLGPMERVFIVGLGLAGHLTAASIVIAAKGLLRWPELRSDVAQQRVHRLTEYFLVGSFASWLVALGSLVLLAQ